MNGWPTGNLTTQGCPHDTQVYRGPEGEWRCCRCSAEIPVQVYEPAGQTTVGSGSGPRLLTRVP